MRVHGCANAAGGGCVSYTLACVTIGAIILGVLGFGAAAWFTLWTISKRVSYYVREPIELLAAMEDRVRSQLTVSVKGKEVDKPVAIELNFRNTGAREVLAEDIEEPLLVVVDGARVASASCEPQNRCSWVGNVKEDDGRTTTVVFDLHTLNRFETFVVTLLLDGMPEKISATCRVRGQTRRNLVNARAMEAQLRKWIPWLVLVAWLLASTWVGVVNYQVTGKAGDSWGAAAFIAFFPLAIVLMLRIASPKKEPSKADKMVLK